MSAEALVACRVAAVINVAPSISGRYPNLGPEILVGAGVPLLDIPAPPESRDPGDPAQRASADRSDADNVNIFAAVREGESLRVDNNAVYRDDQLLLTGPCSPRRPCRKRWTRRARACPSSSRRSRATP